MCFRRQFVFKMWPFQLAFLHFTACRMLLSSLTSYNTSSFSNVWSIWWLPITSFPDNQEWQGLWNVALLPSAARWPHMRILLLSSSASTHIWMLPWIIHWYYLLTPWSRVLLEKLTGSAASQEIPRIFGTRRFLTVLTSVCHLSLS